MVIKAVEPGEKREVAITVSANTAPGVSSEHFYWIIYNQNDGTTTQKEGVFVYPGGDR